MTVALTKKSIIVIVIAVILLLSGGIGYILWQTSQDKQISEQESEAACVVNTPACDKDCCTGHEYKADEYGYTHSICTGTVDCSADSDCTGGITYQTEVCRGKLSEGSFCEVCSSGTASERITNHLNDQCNAPCTDLTWMQSNTGDGKTYTQQQYDKVRTQCFISFSYGQIDPRTTVPAEYADCIKGQIDAWTGPGTTYICHNLWQGGKSWDECAPAPVLSCGDQCTTLDQTCVGDNTICKSTPLGNRCVDPDNYDDVGKTIDQDYFDAGCEWPAPVNPDWSIEKRSNGYCIDENTENPKFKVDYSIIVRNTSSVNGDLDRVVDRPENTKTVWLVQSSIAPLGGVVNGGSNGLIVDITWTLVGADKTFTGGSSRTYSYSVIIPKDGFSKNYRNRVTGYPSSGSEFSADSNIWASCKLPPTGIFDSVMSKVLVGTLLMLLGGVYLYSFSIGNKTLLMYQNVFGLKGKKNTLKRKVAKDRL